MIQDVILAGDLEERARDLAMLAHKGVGLWP
jgi:hypothetical protein